METKIIEIETGRDAGKRFEITEMPVSRLEKWAARALIALFGQAVPPDMSAMAENSNALAVMSLGLKTLPSALAGLDWHRAEPLYDELLRQIAVVTAQGARVPLRPENIDNHVFDVATMFRLRYEAVAINFAFFPDAGAWNSLLGSGAAPAA